MAARVRRFLKKLAAAVTVFVLLWLLLPKPDLLKGVPFSRQVFDRNGKLLAVTLATDGRHRIFTPLKQISPDLVEMTLEREDKYFARHPGLNPVALVRSAWRFALSGQTRHGASTLTMQLARLRYGLHTRTIPGKLQQMLIAVELERHYSKREILEAYFNLAPYGGNIEGAGAASLAYFRKTPAELTRYEALALSVIPQSPARRAPRKDSENARLQTAIARVAAKFGVADAKDFRVINRGMPRVEAPHFVRHVSEGKTPIDRDLQRLVERRMTIFLRDRQRLDLRNAAVLLLDWRNLDVLASVGSADFFDATISGQVDGTRARRSPGSALKPFVYALAMEQGIIHPDSIVLDAPRHFGSYNPENNDREFAGPLRASDALTRSRNVPAVELTGRLHAPGLYDFLKQEGVKFPKPASYYGLSLPLGGAEVTMQELAKLYALFPRCRDGLEQTSFSRESAFLTLDMLSRNARPGGTSLRAEVSWKTGTSHAYRDAWTAGVCGPYVLVVWVGNFRGKGNPALTGRGAAAPLFFEILEALESAGRLPHVPNRPPESASLRQVELCAESGQLPGKCCKHLRKGWFMPGVSAISLCSLHQEVIIDEETGMRLLIDDGTRKTRREVFEFWPDDVQKLFAQAGLPRRQPPPFAPGVMAGDVKGVLQILSPRPGAIYARRAGDLRDEIALRARTDANTGRVFWFDGAQFLGSCAAQESLPWSPGAGRHEVIVVDQNGRKATAGFRVEVLGG